jgi:cytochrome P450
MQMEVLMSKFDEFTSDPSTPMSSSKLFNIRWWLNLFTFDVITKLAYDDCTDLLSTGTDVVKAETYSGRRYYINAIQAFHTNSRYDVILAHWPKLLSWTKWLTKSHPGNVKGAEFTDLCVRKVRKRFEHDPEFRDFWTNYLVDNKGDDLNLPFRELVSEAGVMINAGSDTSATAMTSAMFHIIKNRHVFDKLRAELDPVLGQGRCVATYDQVKGLKYLRACIEEALRDRPPTGLGLPRVTPPEGAVIAVSIIIRNISSKWLLIGFCKGEYIPGGVTVSVPTYTFHHSESLFPNPWEYRPERWLEDPQSTHVANLRKYVMPFSQGPRACVGRNLAYLEMQILVATLVHNYDWKLESDDFVLPLVERFNQNPGDMHVKISHRSFA